MTRESSSTAVRPSKLAGDEQIGPDREAAEDQEADQLERDSDQLQTEPDDDDGDEDRGDPSGGRPSLQVSHTPLHRFRGTSSQRKLGSQFLKAVRFQLALE